MRKVVMMAMIALGFMSMVAGCGVPEVQEAQPPTAVSETATATPAPTPKDPAQVEAENKARIEANRTPSQDGYGDWNVRVYRDESFYVNHDGKWLHLKIYDDPAKVSFEVRQFTLDGQKVTPIFLAEISGKGYTVKDSIHVFIDQNGDGMWGVGDRFFMKVVPQPEGDYWVLGTNEDRISRERP